MARLKSTASPYRNLQFCSTAQQELFQYGPAPMVASGGWGAGKTVGCALKALALSDAYPGNRGVIARSVWEELKTTTMTSFFKVCPPEAYNRTGRRADSDKYLRLNNGSEILWMHLDDPERENVVKGLEINWFLLDQGEDVEEQIFDSMTARLGRWDAAKVPVEMLQAELQAGRDWKWKNPVTGVPTPPTYPMMTVNPADETHWVYRRFHEESEEHWERSIKQRDGSMASYHDLGYKMIHMPSTDNIFLSDQYISTLLSKDEAFVRRYVKALWGMPEGKIHAVPPESIIPGDPDFVDYLKRTCILGRSMDHGDSAPTVCLWWADDEQGNTYCFREYYMPNQLISTHRDNITSLSEGERYVLNTADPSIFYKMAQKHGGRWSTAEEYSDTIHQPRRTALFWTPGDNNELGTRNRISEYFRVDPQRVHPYTKQKGAPRLYFVQRSEAYPQGCTNAIKETRAARRVRLGTDLGRPSFSDERDPKVVDHAYDCVRYWIASRPPLAPRLQPDRHPGSFLAVAQDLRQFQSRGGFHESAARARIDAKKFR